MPSTSRSISTLATARRGGRRCLPGLLAVAVFTALCGCDKHTYLVVDFASDGTLPPIYGLRVALTLSPPSGPTRQSVDTLPSTTNTAVVVLPTSAAFRLDDADGSLDISADALSGKRESVARGTVHTTVEHDQTWTVILTLTTQQALSTQPLHLGPTLPASDEDDSELERHAQAPSWVPAAPLPP